MQFFTHLKSDDTATARIRLNKDELKALRTFMHTPDHYRNVCLPNGVSLHYRGCGWYCLDTTNHFRGCDKINSAMAILKKFKREFDAAIVAEVRRLMLLANPRLANATQQRTTHKSTPIPVPVPVPKRVDARRPADPQKLQQLAHIFSAQKASAVH
jgi:hypothetical protein